MRKPTELKANGLATLEKLKAEDEFAKSTSCSNALSPTS